MPISRRATSEVLVFHRDGPQSVTYDLSKADSVTITVPGSSSWTSGPHWHESHTEYLQVLQGRAFVRLGDRCGEYSPADGIIEVPKYVVHEWHRARGDPSSEELKVREWTEPRDGQKEVFFRMLNSFLTEDQPGTLYRRTAVPEWLRAKVEEWVIVIQLYCIFRSWDNWPVLLGHGGGWLCWMNTHLALGVAAVAGHAIGLQGVYSEYVADGLLRRATSRGVERKKLG